MERGKDFDLRLFIKALRYKVWYILILEKLVKRIYIKILMMDHGHVKIVNASLLIKFYDVCISAFLTDVISCNLKRIKNIMYVKK